MRPSGTAPIVTDPTPKPTIEELNAQHDRSAFDCGVDALNDFLRRFAGQNRKTRVDRTFVATQEDRPRIIGYYSIATGAVRFTTLPESAQRRLPKYPVPVAHLGRLAVDRSAQGRGLGEHLLIDAFARIASAADSIGIHAIEVIAIDESARNFYLRYGFTPLLDDPRHLYIPMRTIKSLNLQ